MVCKGEKGVSPVVATIMMVVLTVILAAAVVVYVTRVGGIKSMPVAYLSLYGVQKSGDNYVIEVSNEGETLDTSELTITVNGEDVEAEWNVAELKGGRRAKATLGAGVTLKIGDEVAIVYEPTTMSLLSSTTITEIEGDGGAGGPTYEFLVTADKVVMENWKMEGGGKTTGFGVWVDNDDAHFFYHGQEVTRITADLQVLTNMYQSRFEITADEFRAVKVLVYVTHVDGTAAGVFASWDGDEEVPQPISAVTDPNTVVPMTNVILYVVHVDAESATLTSYLSENEMDLHVDQVVLTGWSITGGGKKAAYTLYDPPAGSGGDIGELDDDYRVYHNSQEVTETAASIIEAQNLSLVKDSKWRIQADEVVQENARLLSTSTSGNAAGVQQSWDGDEPVPVALMLVPDPCTPPNHMADMTLDAVYIYSDRITLMEMDQSVIS